MASQVKYNDNDRVIVATLKGTEGLTLAEINAATGMEFKPGHIVAAMRKGLIESVGEREVLRPSKKTVSTYVFATSDAMVKEDGKPHNYTDGERAILAAASSIDSPFTLADLASAMGVEKLSSGSINSLVKKGNITKGEQIVIPTTAKSLVKVYGFVADVPAEQQIIVDNNRPTSL